MTVSLVISSYNWKEALQLCLLSVTRQTVLPFEVIIADDGSNDETKKIVHSFQELSLFPIKHVWHEDKGWRKCVILNKAFALCQGDYIIEIDGDIILHSHFIQDHLSEALPGYYLLGSRGKINENISNKFLKTDNYSLSLFTIGIRRKVNILRFPWLTPFFYNHNSGRGCNVSFWKRDILNINGYDESFNKYGYEDDDLFARLCRSGVKRRFVKFKAIEYHIFHQSTPLGRFDVNRYIYDNNNKDRIIKCIKGLHQYL